MPNPTNAIETFFWDNLTQGGLDLVDADRVEQLFEYAKNNQISTSGVMPNGTGDRSEVDAFERSAISHLLESDSWRSLLTDDGVSKMEERLGIVGQDDSTDGGHDALGSVPTGSIPLNMAGRLGRGGIRMRQLTAVFNHDYERKKAELFENPSLSADERAKNVLYLLQDYAKALNEAGGGPEVTSQRRALLEAFFDKPYAAVYGAGDPDGDLLATAWEIVWGVDPERAQTSFDIDSSKKWIAYMNMNGGFIETAKKVDDLLKAQGREAKLEKYERMSPLNWIVGEQPGNTKPSWTFKEDSAISSTGVDFAVKLLDNERAVGDRELDPSFDMKVDFYAWGNFVSLNKARGETLVPKHDETGATLTVEVENVGDAHWKPVFKDADGNTVEPSQVTCVIEDSRGNVKGDGKATGSYSASWWGFCGRTAMQGLVTLKYGFPKPQRDVTLTVNGQAFTFTQSEITGIVGRRLTEIFPKHNQAGNRYDDDPDQVHLKSGTVLKGKINTKINFYRPDTYRTGDTMVLVPGDADGPKGSLGLVLEDGGNREVPVDDIKEVRRASVSGPGAQGATKDTIVLHDGTELVGTLESNVSFAGASTASDGSLVLENSASNPIMGDIKMTTTKGEEKRVALSDVQYMVREDENEVLADEALAYVIRNRGIFSADSWTGSSVANGTRTIEEIKHWKAGDGNRPEWVPDEIIELKGYKGEVKNPDNLRFFSMGNKGSTYGGVKFWMEVDDNNMPINVGTTSGQWDFLWGVEGEPNWNTKATFNPHMPNDLVVELYVKSLENPEDAAKVLPSNWRDYLTT
ncbi:MAG: hypothetical protein V3T05_05230 [Myxococcota bacterium]